MNKIVNCGCVKDIFAIMHTIFYEDRAKPSDEACAYTEKYVHIALVEKSDKNRQWKWKIIL